MSHDERSMDEELAAILAGALDVTGGVGCLPGCTAPAEEEASHICTSPIGTLRDVSGAEFAELEVAVTRSIIDGVPLPPYVQVTAWHYVRRDRAGRRREERATPAPGFRRTAAIGGSGLALGVGQLLDLVELLAAAGEQCEAHR